jgi:hypothetical protein
MKRSELVVGAELYHRSGKHRNARKVRVLSTEPHEASQWTDTIRKTDKGNGVLIEWVRLDGQQGRAGVVQLAHLKGDWETEDAREKAERAAEQREYEERQAERRVREEMIRDLVRRLSAAVGTEIVPRAYSTMGGVTLTFSLLDVQTIITKLEARS